MDHCCVFGRIVNICSRYYLIWRRCDRQECERLLSQPDFGIPFSEKRISQWALAAKKKKKKKKQKKKKKGSSNAINASARSYISKRYDYSLKKQSCTVLSVLHVLSMSLLYRKPSRSINCQNDGLNKAWSYLRLLILQKVHYHSFGIVWFWVTWVWWVSRLF